MVFPVNLSQRAIRDLNGIYNAKAAETSRPQPDSLVCVTPSPALQRCQTVARSLAINPEYRQLTYSSKPHIYRILYTSDQEKAR